MISYFDYLEYRLVIEQSPNGTVSSSCLELNYAHSSQNEQEVKTNFIKHVERYLSVYSSIKESLKYKRFQ